MAVKERLLLVDGYNVLGAWPEMSKDRSMADAREALIHRLQDYAGYSGQRIIVVFDAWQSDRRMRTQENLNGLEVVFTQKGETADHYIERLCDQYGRQVTCGRIELRVATSDRVEQTVVLGRGAMRVSSRELIYEINQDYRGNREQRGAQSGGTRTLVWDQVPQETREKLERMRRGVK